jgi:hypothetical protein
MRIDVLDGTVSFGAGTIKRSFDTPTFLKSPVGAASKKSLENAGWVHLDFNPEPGILGTALFKDNRIHQLFLLMSTRTDQSEDWSEKHELDRKALHDEWLLAELGEPPYEYAWGNVTSDYDPKGRVSEIIITYAE